MSEHVRCFCCGFRTNNRGLFVRYNGNGDHHWLDFSCPQCCRASPRLAMAETYPSDPPPAFKPPQWVVETTNYGLYVSAGSLSSPMIPEHQLWRVPASLLDPHYVGTFADYSRDLMKVGDARAKQFHERHAEIMAEYNKLKVARNGVQLLADQEWLNRVTDEARQACLIGPHERRKHYDGPSLEDAARKLGTLR